MRLRGRNGGLSLKCRWEALWAIGVKDVSLRSTLSVVSVVLGGLVCPYICNADFVGWLVSLYICEAVCLSCWGFGVILNFLHLF